MSDEFPAGFVWDEAEGRPVYRPARDEIADEFTYQSVHGSTRAAMALEKALALIDKLVDELDPDTDEPTEPAPSWEQVDSANQRFVDLEARHRVLKEALADPIARFGDSLAGPGSPEHVYLIYREAALLRALGER